jgi:hypothetical protein
MTCEAKNQDAPTLNEAEAHFFYAQQFHLADAQQRTPDQWRQNADFWRWVAVAQSVSVISTEGVLSFLRNEAKGIKTDDPDFVRRFKAWVWAEIEASLERVHLGISPPAYNMLHEH